MNFQSIKYTISKISTSPLTSRSPHFKRDDIAERLLITKVKRFDDFIPMNVLVDEILENRDAIMTEVIYQIYEAGTYNVDWDTTNHASGIYFYRLKAGDLEVTKKMILLK